LADSFRAEFNPKGVRTLTVFPGRTGTDMQRRLHEGRGEAFVPETFIQPSDVASTVLHLLQLPRTVEVTEIFMRPMRNWLKPGVGL
jgi:NADP-dependent 3-hydroxy acid dehydrogenase YdfG